MTLNLHCLVETDLHQKQQRIASYISEKDIDIIFFQEVAQTQTAPITTDSIKEDNYILTLKRMLQEEGHLYHIYYEPFKTSFGRYDEGLGFLSKHPLTLQEKKQISKTSDYQDWHRRYVVTYYVEIGQTSIYLSNTHFGWSDDAERFEDQYDQAKETLPDQELGFLVGDYNIPPTSNEYRHIMSHQMIDLFDTDAFRNQPTYWDENKQVRIDYIMSNKPINILHQELVFTDKRVSDHAGLYLEFQLK